MYPWRGGLCIWSVVTGSAALAWRLMTLETAPCVEALSEALAWEAFMNTEIHLRRLSHGLAGRRDEHGRQGRVARQFFVGHDQIRGSLGPKRSARRGLGRYLSTTGADHAWRANARSSLWQPAQANPGSGITRAEIHLSIACKLFLSNLKKKTFERWDERINQLITSAKDKKPKNDKGGSKFPVDLRFRRNWNQDTSPLLNSPLACWSYFNREVAEIRRPSIYLDGLCLSSIFSEKDL